jgi:NADPH:quinone reductase-like Zn-dependent oxidoreductase
MRKSMVLHKTGRKPLFRLEENETVKPKGNDILIEVHTAGINFADVLMAQGLYPDAPELPSIPGYEIAGFVKETGKGTRFNKGDRVVALTYFGGYTDEIIIHEEQAILLPKTLTLEEAVTIPVNYVTAAIALIDMCRVREGDWVLVHGGAGGVGRLALQIAKTLGAKTIATVGSAVKFKTAKEAGADYVVNYREKDFRTEVQKITRGRGADCILDPIGGRNLIRDFGCLVPSGRVVLFGLADIMKEGKASRIGGLTAFVKSLRFSPMLLMNRNNGVFGLNVLKYFGTRAEERLQAHLREGIALAAKKKIIPLIGGSYKLEDAQCALIELASRKTVGKLILKCR